MAHRRHCRLARGTTHRTSATADWGRPGGDRARVGLAPGDVIRAIRVGLVGEEGSQIWLGQRRFDLVVRLRDDRRDTFDAIRALLIDGHDGREIPLASYTDVQVETPRATTQSVLVPRSSVQNLGDRTVVYLSDPRQPGRFTEREVRLGPVSEDRVVVLAGVESGDSVVTSGSFSLRAERERRGLRARP